MEWTIFKNSQTEYNGDGPSCSDDSRPASLPRNREISSAVERFKQLPILFVFGCILFKRFFFGTLRALIIIQLTDSSFVLARACDSIANKTELRSIFKFLYLFSFVLLMALSPPSNNINEASESELL